jgi:hypothetical protein
MSLIVLKRKPSPSITNTSIFTRHRGARTTMDARYDAALPMERSSRMVRSRSKDPVHWHRLRSSKVLPKDETERVSSMFGRRVMVVDDKITASRPPISISQLVRTRWFSPVVTVTPVRSTRFPSRQHRNISNHLGMPNVVPVQWQQPIQIKKWYVN